MPTGLRHSVSPSSPTLRLRVSAQPSLFAGGRGRAVGTAHPTSATLLRRWQYYRRRPFVMCPQGLVFHPWNAHAGMKHGVLQHHQERDFQAAISSYRFRRVWNCRGVRRFGGDLGAAVFEFVVLWVLTLLSLPVFASAAPAAFVAAALSWW